MFFMTFGLEKDTYKDKRKDIVPRTNGEESHISVSSAQLELTLAKNC